MAGSINPQTNDPEFSLTPSREFNFWMDPEASHAVLHAQWPRIALTTVDISVKTRMGKDLIEQVPKSTTPAAQYLAKYGEANYLWDELAAVAWLDPSIITKWKKLYMMWACAQIARCTRRCPAEFQIAAQSCPRYEGRSRLHPRRPASACRSRLSRQ